MTFQHAILTGVPATLAMTLFADLSFRAINRPYRVIRILANMIRFQPSTSIQANPFPQVIIAGIIHFAIGIFFAYCFQLFLFWLPEWPLSLQVMAYGVLISLIAVGGWRLFFELHPDPPAVDLPEYLAVIAVGHMVLTLALAGLERVV